MLEIILIVCAGFVAGAIGGYFGEWVRRKQVESTHSTSHNKCCTKQKGGFNN